MDQVVEDLLNCLDDPALALLQWKEAFGVVQVLPPSYSIVVVGLCILFHTFGAWSASIPLRARKRISRYAFVRT